MTSHVGRPLGSAGGSVLYPWLVLQFLNILHEFAQIGLDVGESFLLGHVVFVIFFGDLFDVFLQFVHVFLDFIHVFLNLVNVLLDLFERGGSEIHAHLYKDRKINCFE